MTRANAKPFLYTYPTSARSSPLRSSAPHNPVLHHHCHLTLHRCVCPSFLLTVLITACPVAHCNADHTGHSTINLAWSDSTYHHLPARPRRLSCLISCLSGRAFLSSRQSYDHPTKSHAPPASPSSPGRLFSSSTPSTPTSLSLLGDRTPLFAFLRYAQL